MLRRLLTCLALITGLAAVAAPAGAVYTGSVAERIDAGISAAQEADRACVSLDQPAPDPRAASRRAQCPAPMRPVIIYIPTVQFGADRAFE